MTIPSFQHCIRCTICVENCPVSTVNTAFPGPKQAGPDAQRLRLDGGPSRDEWVQLCTQCRRCQVSCPYDVDPSQIILEAQLKYGGEHRRSLVQRLFANNHYLGAFGSLVAPLANAVSRLGLARRAMALFGISRNLPFPRFHMHTMARSRRRRGAGGRKVAFFYGCYLNYYQPELGRRIVEFLTSVGLEVVLPPQVCCGLPALGNGDRGAAQRFAHRNTRTLADHVARGYDILYSCTSCGNTLIDDYPGHMAVPGAETVARRCYHVGEYLLMLIQEGRWRPSFSGADVRVAYHIPCHLRTLGIGYPMVRLLRSIPGLDCRILDEHCCGLAGSYGMKTKNEETAKRLGRQAADAVLRVEPDYVVSDCGACRMQLSHLSGLPARDPLEFLIDGLAATAAPLPVAGRAP